MATVTHSVVRARVDPELKRKADETLKGMGVTTSAAIRMFLVQVVADQALPFKVKLPNETTREAVAAARAEDVASFTSVDDLFTDLNED